MELYISYSILSHCIVLQYEYNTYLHDEQKQGSVYFATKIAAA